MIPRTPPVHALALLAAAAVACQGQSTGLVPVRPGDAGAVTGTGGKAGSGGGGGKAGTDGSAGVGGSAGSFTQIITPPAKPKLDLVFMVDNSSSMEPKQQALAAAIPLLVSELRKAPGGLPDLHVGVVTSDVGAGPYSDVTTSCGKVLGDRGRFQPGECGLQAGQLWLAQSPGQSPNFSGSLASVLACMVKVGASGCSYEHSLQAVRVALSEKTTPEHIGFLRQDAMLGLILVSDEDDCSATPTSDMFQEYLPGESASLRCETHGSSCYGQPLEYPTTRAFSAPLSECRARDDAGLALIRVQEFVDSVRGVKPRPHEQVVVAGIFGWPTGDPAATTYGILNNPASDPQMRDIYDLDPICQAEVGRVRPGLRLKAFVDAFGSNGRIFSLCEPVAGALQAMGQGLRQRMESWCIDKPVLDTDPATPGTQPACQVSLRMVFDSATLEAPVPRCGTNPASPTCWEYLEDPTSCPRSGLRVRLDQQGAVGTAETQLVLTCTGEGHNGLVLP